MIVATHQPIFLPWPGFYYKAALADLVVLLDDVQFPQGRSWMNRNRLKSEQGEWLLTTPVVKRGRGKQRIRHVEVCDDGRWRNRHLTGIRQLYAHAPYLAEYFPALERAYRAPHRHLVTFNRQLLEIAWEALGIRTRYVMQSELGVTGQGTPLLADLARAVGADELLALRFVEKFIDGEILAQAGVSLRTVNYRPPVYPQLWGPFRYNLSALDLVLNHGPKSRDILFGAATGR